jgi:hypothetical protein
MLGHWVLSSLKGRYQQVDQELLKRTKLEALFSSPVFIGYLQLLYLSVGKV